MTRGSDLQAAVPFHGAAAEAARVPQIKAPLMILYAERDERVNALWPGFEAALKAAGVALSRGVGQARVGADDGVVPQAPGLKGRIAPAAIRGRATAPAY